MWSSTLSRLTPAVRRMLDFPKPSTSSWPCPRRSVRSGTGRQRPLAACLLLLGLAAAQLSWPAAGQPDSGAPPSPPPPTTAPVPAAGPWTDLAGRPLFSPTRRPGPPQDTTPSSLDGMVVLGIARTDRNAAAVIRLPSGKIIRVQPGQGVEGWIMASVEPLRLVFEKEGATRAIPLEPKKLRPPPPARRARP